MQSRGFRSQTCGSEPFFPNFFPKPIFPKCLEKFRKMFGKLFGKKIGNRTHVTGVNSEGTCFFGHDMSNALLVCFRADVRRYDHVVGYDDDNFKKAKPTR